MAVKLKVKSVVRSFGLVIVSMPSISEKISADPDGDDASPDALVFQVKSGGIGIRGGGIGVSPAGPKLPLLAMAPAPVPFVLSCVPKIDDSTIISIVGSLIVKPTSDEASNVATGTASKLVGKNKLTANK